MPATGGVVIACNHFSWVDPAALGAACPRTMYFMAKIEAHRVPGLGQLIRAFGTFSVRRGESDREAVRMMRQIVHDGKALGLFVEGTRQRSGVPGEIQPGAAMVALQEGVPIVPVALHGSQTWKPGNFRPVSVAFGTPMTFAGVAEGRPRLSGGIGARAGRDPAALRLARRAARARPAAGRDPTVMKRPETGRAPWRPRSPAPSRSSAFPTWASPRSSTGSPRAGRAVVHETPGVTRDRKELLCEWSGQRVPADRHRWCRRRGQGAVRTADRRSGAHCRRGGRSRSLHRRTRGRGGDSRGCRAGRDPSRLEHAGDRAREQDRRSPPRRRRAASSTASVSAIRCRSRRCTVTAAATCWTRSLRGCRAAAGRPSATRRSGWPSSGGRTWASPRS